MVMGERDETKFILHISTCQVMQDYGLLLVILDTDLDFYVPGCLHWKLKNSLDFKSSAQSMEGTSDLFYRLSDYNHILMKYFMSCS